MFLFKKMEQKKEKEIKLKAKAFLFTLFKINEWGPILEYLQSLTSRNYLLVSREFAPKTGSEHYHIYIQFKYTVTLSRKKLLSANIQICRGTPQQNIDYVKKEGDILLEEGEPRLGKGSGKGYTIKEVKAMTDEERDNLPFTSYNRLQALKRDELGVLSASKYPKEVDVYYIFGPTGAGKTTYALTKIKELKDLKLIESDNFNEVKFTNDFWIGVSNANMTQVALYDDFRDSDMCPTEFIRFIDYNTHMINIKYGSALNKFKYIFITSIQDPYDLYKKYQKSENLFVSNEAYDESKEQWTRRMTEIIKIENRTIKMVKKMKETQSSK